MPRTPQIPLPFLPRQSQRFSNFFGRQNEEAISHLCRRRSEFCFSWLYGPQGSGKTHILHSAVAAQEDLGGRAVYVDAKRAANEGYLEGLERFNLVALDNLPLWLTHDENERALLGLYQGLLATAGHLVVSATTAPSEVRPRLADLASRFQSAHVFRIRELDEANLRRLLHRHARDRGLLLPSPVLDFWLTRRNRSLPSLLTDLERLDQAAWSEQRKLTIPFLKAVLGAEPE